MYKRIKNGKNSYTTFNTKTGVTTNSHSTGNKNYRSTYTQLSNGKSYTTTTTNLGGGWVEKQRTSAYNPKQPKQRKVNYNSYKRNSMSFKYTPQLFLIACILFLISALIG